jgi:hypothetical protein
LVIAQVTAVLKALLESKLSKHASAAGAGEASVSLLPPDRVSADERSQLNLFLYRVAPHSRYGNERVNERVPNGSNGRPSPQTLPSIALDLYYLISAYGSQDFHTEILLGYAVQALNETPLLKRANFESALAPGKFQHPSWGALSQAASPLAESAELRITPQFLSMEDTGKLWSSLQARYRPSVAYEVSAVVIDATADAVSEPSQALIKHD